MPQLRPQRFGSVPDGLPSYHREFLRKLKDAVEILIGAKSSQLDAVVPPRSQAVTFSDLAEVPSHADNAAALLAGLKAGDMYRTGDVLKVVHPS